MKKTIIIINRLDIKIGKENRIKIHKVNNNN